MNEKEIRSSFDRQGLMGTLNAKLVTVEKGKVVIECPLKDGLTQQHGFFHAGVLTSIADSACGYAANTVMPEGKEVLTIEFKVNFLRPATTPKLIATGSVLQSGKTITVCEANVYDATQAKLIARMQATMFAVDV